MNKIGHETLKEIAGRIAADDPVGTYMFLRGLVILHDGQLPEECPNHCSGVMNDFLQDHGCTIQIQREDCREFMDILDDVVKTPSEDDIIQWLIGSNGTYDTLYETASTDKDCVWTKTLGGFMDLCRLFKLHEKLRRKL